MSWDSTVKMRLLKYLFICFIFLHPLSFQAYCEEIVENKKQAHCAEIDQNKKKEIKILPHKAEYKISLVKNSNPDIQDVSGTLTISLRECNGFIMEQHAILDISYYEEDKDICETFLATWESENNEHYHFYLKTTLNHNEESIIRGKALLTKDVQEVSYELPEKCRVTIPLKTLFPLHFLKTLIEECDQKKETHSALVFDGSNPKFEVLQVNTLLQSVEKKINIEGNQKFSVNPSFALQMAVYESDNKSMDPLSIASQVVQENGIIISLQMDFPEKGFTTKAQLIKVDL